MSLSRNWPARAESVKANSSGDVKSGAHSGTIIGTYYDYGDDRREQRALSDDRNMMPFEILTAPVSPTRLCFPMERVH